MKLGYIPLDKSGTAASSTLEYAYDDWTIYQTALKAGNKEIAETYRKRALNYRTIYDTSIGFARPRYSDGSFKKEFDVLQTYGEGFIEGNSLEFLFSCATRCIWHDRVDGRRRDVRAETG